MADRISLTGLAVHGHHGVFEHEKRDGQEFRVDITVWANLADAAATDDVRETVHYAEMAQRAAEIVGGESCDLIETVAARVADRLMTDNRLHAAEVTIHKPSAPIPLRFDDVSVTMRRSRRGGRGGQAVSA